MPVLSRTAGSPRAAERSDGSSFRALLPLLGRISIRKYAAATNRDTARAALGRTVGDSGIDHDQGTGRNVGRASAHVAAVSRSAGLAVQQPYRSRKPVGSRGPRRACLARRSILTGRITQARRDHRGAAANDTNRPAQCVATVARVAAIAAGRRPGSIIAIHPRAPYPPNTLASTELKYSVKLPLSS